MKPTLCFLSLCFSAFFVMQSCQPPEPIATTYGPEVVSFRVLPFQLKNVKLVDGPFLRATELNIQSLFNYEPDRFLSPFLVDAGLHPKAERYGGWEGMSIAGHSLGHYMSACALMYQATGNEEFLQRVNYMVDELFLCQEANGDGYIGAFTRVDLADVNIFTRQEGPVIRGKQVFEEEIAKGIIVSAPFSLNGIWAPFYTQHKIFAGLRDAYLLCGNQKALEVKKAFADWLYGILAHLPDEAIQEILVCEYGGINEVLVELYGITGEEKYLELSHKFHDEKVLGPLFRKEDQLQGLHANTQIPKIIGLARRYELTGNQHERNTAEFFWQTVINSHTYVTGGNCNEEYFGEPGKLRDRLGPNSTETCNVYNMLRLSNYLFTWNAEARLADYIERALLNHIYASQHPRDGRVIYNLNIDMGGHKSFEDPFGFTCCVGSGMESHSKYGTFIYFHNDEELFVNQYIASELTWEDKNIVLTQETAFPEEEGTRFTFECRDPVLFTLQIRYPQWAERGMQVWVNGEQQKIRQQPGSFFPIKRVWSTADEVRVSFPFSLRLENMPDDKNRVAVFNGPVLLAGDLGPENDPKLVDPFYVPVFRTSDRDPANWIEPLDKLHHFVTKAGQPRNVNLLPFYSVIDRSYSIFWDMMTDGRWEEKKKMHQRQKEATTALKSKTFDFVNPGEIESEYLKSLQGVGTESFLYKQRLCREATRGGWFSYDLNIPLNEKVSLVVKYWGGFEGSRTFSILVNGHTVAIENIAGMRDGHFVNVSYALPIETTNDKEVIRIKFVPHDFHYAGPVFGIRTIRTTDLDDMELNLAIL